MEIMSRVGRDSTAGQRQPVCGLIKRLINPGTDRHGGLPCRKLNNFTSLLDNMRTSQKATKPDGNHVACRPRFNSGPTATSVRLDQAFDKPRAGPAWRIAMQEIEQLYKFTCQYMNKSEV
jgi:hypothetical protein